MSNAHSGLVQGIPTFGGRVHPPATVRDGAGVAQVRPLLPELPRASGLLPTRRGHLGRASPSQAAGAVAARCEPRPPRARAIYVP